MIISLIINLNNRNEIDEIIKIKYPAIYNNLDNPSNVLLYQVAQHFTFYHELAHLIQKSDLLYNFLYERPQQQEHFSIVNYKLELDADELATATHIHQYIFKIFGENIDNQKVESITELFCFGILLYMLSFDAIKN
ncbi:hypothetical protein [Flavobacterium ginsengiterrae]|uniref:IrrE N-terminal-like domain-containing protein n=1 Tax=Flavobacterium ginsengiterrae TaxID=871695 RepID=A0ABP7GSS6_9FLAO